MKTLCEQLNFSDCMDVDRAVKIDSRRDVNYYETLMLYCANNNIDMHNFDDSDIDNAVIYIEDYAAAQRRRYDSDRTFYFWVQ